VCATRTVLQGLKQLVLARAVNKQQQQQQMAGVVTQVLLQHQMKTVKVKMTACRLCSRTTTAGLSHTTCQTVTATVKGSEGPSHDAPVWVWGCTACWGCWRECSTHSCVLTYMHGSLSVWSV
jgi:hypothetical protein